jgi:hypothetical protein
MSHLKRPWRADIRAIATVALGVGAVAGALGSYMLEGTWKPTGDGRTIFNSRTGEIRLSATGESVVIYRQRLEAEQLRAAADEAKRKRAEQLAAEESAARKRAQLTTYEFMATNGGSSAPQSRGRAERNALRSALRQSSDSHLSSKLAEFMAAGDQQGAEICEAHIEARRRVGLKQDLFAELKAFTEKYPNVFTSTVTLIEWVNATQPLRIKDALSQGECAILLGALGEVVVHKDFQRNDDFAQAIRVVREYQRSPKRDGYNWWMADWEQE